jgi:hypothetical protein
MLDGLRYWQSCQIQNILRFTKWFLSFTLYNRNSYAFVIFSTRSICPTKMNTVTNILFSIRVMLLMIIITITIKKLRGLNPRSNYTERPPLVGDVSANFCGWGCHMVSVTDSYGRIIGLLDRSRYFFVQVAPQLYSRGWVDAVPDPLFLRKSGSAENRTWRTSGSVTRNSDH